MFLFSTYSSVENEEFSTRFFLNFGLHFLILRKTGLPDNLPPK